MCCVMHVHPQSKQCQCRKQGCRQSKSCQCWLNHFLAHQYQYSKHPWRKHIAICGMVSSTCPISLKVWKYFSVSEGVVTCRHNVQAHLEWRLECPIPKEAFWQLASLHAKLVHAQSTWAPFAMGSKECDVAACRHNALAHPEQWKEVPRHDVSFWQMLYTGLQINIF